ncbi:permease [Craterilacuibacter sp. RT1T]|uniref:permease n=1 Tax=Craterilacuibacter sp. RT1T TaxID=2942211 RepID=UPI0020BFF34D|nr:permease [Craterilacuibacter sp. RT1T]MCL6262614.1 permease [Craterilacuibacter sp. RT1T]
MLSFSMASLQSAAAMFVFLALELSLLFVLISFAVAVIQHKLPAGKVQSLLSSKKGSGYLTAAAIGSVTPFCSCSTIPMLNGLLRAGAGFGPTMTFLFVSPLLNPIVVGLLWMTFGWKVTLVYMAATLLVSLLAGVLLERLNFGRYVKQTAPQASACCTTKPAVEPKASCCAPKPVEPKASCCVPKPVEPKASCCVPKPVEPKTSCCMPKPVEAKASCCAPKQVEFKTSCCMPKAAAPMPEKAKLPWRQLWREAFGQFRAVFPYLMLGVAIGAFTYGFIPSEWIAAHTGSDKPLAIPLAAVAGIPLYLRAETLIPMASMFALKGMGLGALMALIIGGAGASLTELILLKALFRKQILIAFLVVIIGTAISAGYLFSALTPWLA